VLVAVKPVDGFTERQRRDIAAAAARYGAFHGAPVDLTFD